MCNKHDNNHDNGDAQISYSFYQIETAIYVCLRLHDKT